MSAMRALGDDLWYLRGPDFTLPGGARMPLGCTVARLRDRSLLIYAPIGFDAEAAAAIDTLGRVAHLVAPNLFHHLYLSDALARWPDARLHAPAGLAAKRPDLPPARGLDAPDPAWGGALELIRIDGAPRLDEHVLLHRPSGTLLCADLCFHIGRPANLASRLVFGLMGVGGERLAQSRAWRLLARDRAAARVAVERVLAWPIRQIAPCHGEPVAVTAGELRLVLNRIG